MTPLKRTVSRMSQTRLSNRYGPDKQKRIALAIIPGNGRDVPDSLELWPAKTRRRERINIDDVYQYALRCRVNREVLEKARKKKEQKKQQRLARQIAYHDRKLRTH